MKTAVVCLHAVLVLILPGTVLCGLLCTQQHLCHCALPNNTYIDLSPLANVTFDQLFPNGDYKYAINLCQPFNKTEDCTNVYACQYNNETGKFNALGNNVPTFIDINTLMLENNTSKVYIELLCSGEDYTLDFGSQFSERSPFNFTLKSKYACPLNGSLPTTAPSTTSSVVTTHGINVTTTGSTLSTVVTISVKTSASSGTTTKGTSTQTPPTTSSRNPTSTTIKVSSTTHKGAAPVLSSMTTPIMAVAVLIAVIISK
ncbi:cell wall protein DAN4 [Biomphalaria pfeifferi]|uniref:Cell wall protein DAN4 n=1 Tax=Biomphalaria pfeifferi TaxID=112525 RepID=A0AAD8BG98_BIOPF|nr:cell wall protein DAN4 [Biomphalaria pfeifferi]